jgi:hypothetical protein
MKTDSAYTPMGRFPTDRVILVRDEDGSLEVTALIRDAEADPIRIRFDYDGTFTILTDDYSYVMLGEPFLKSMSRLLKDARALYEILEPYFDENGDLAAPEELITTPMPEQEVSSEPVF